MDVKREARAFLVWRFCTGKEWDVTFKEIQLATGLSKNEVRSVMAFKKWYNRIRSTPKLTHPLEWGNHYMIGGMVGKAEVMHLAKSLNETE